MPPASPARPGRSASTSTGATCSSSSRATSSPFPRIRSAISCSAAGPMRGGATPRWPPRASSCAASTMRRADSARRIRTGASTTTRCVPARSSAMPTPRRGTPSTAKARRSRSSTSTRRARTRRCSTSPRAPGTSCRSRRRETAAVLGFGELSYGARLATFLDAYGLSDRSRFLHALQRVKLRETTYPLFWRLGPAATAGYLDHVAAQLRWLATEAPAIERAIT